MASSSSSLSIVSLHPPPSNKSNSSRIPNVYEFEYLSEDSKYPLSQYPIINPYHVYQKDRHPLGYCLRHVFGSYAKPLTSKDFVLASQFTSHPLPATTSEQYVTLQIPQNFLTNGEKRVILISILELFGLP